MSLTVEAFSQDDAIRQARKRGMLVASVVKETSASAAQLDEMVAESLAANAPAPEPVGLDDATPYEPSIEPHEIHQPPAPQYGGISKGADLLTRSARSYDTLGILAYAAAGLSVFAGIVGAASGVGSQFISGLVFGISFAIAGVVLRHRAIHLRLLAELSLAMRDMARNSFR